MTDRRGFVFPIRRTWEHRNIVFNSLPTYMADRQGELDAAGITDRHFIFATESPDEVDKIIYAYKNSLSSVGEVRRI